MTPRAAAFWRAEIARLSAIASAALERDMIAEFARAGAEWPVVHDRRVWARRHLARLETLLLMHHRRTSAWFGAAANAQLDGLARRLRVKSEQPAPEKPPKRRVSAGAMAVLTVLARLLVGAANAPALAERLAQNRALVAAAEISIAMHGGNAERAAASLAKQAEIAAAAIDAAVAESNGSALALPAPEPRPALPPPETPASGPSGGAGGQSPPPPPPPPPPRGGPPQRPRRVTFGQRVEAHVRHWTPRRARRIAATSANRLSEVLRRAAIGGWGEERTARAIMGAFGADPGPLPFADREQALADIAGEHGLTLARARTIARTEIGAAQSAATIAMGEVRAERGEEIDKIWITTEDDRRRPSHEAAHGQRVPLEQPFVITDPETQRVTLMMQPGDVAAPLGEIVNCRCGVLLASRGLRYQPSQSAPAAARAG